MGSAGPNPVLYPNPGQCGWPGGLSPSDSFPSLRTMSQSPHGPGPGGVPTPSFHPWLPRTSASPGSASASLGLSQPHPCSSHPSLSLLLLLYVLLSNLSPCRRSPSLLSCFLCSIVLSSAPVPSFLFLSSVTPNQKNQRNWSLGLRAVEETGGSLVLVLRNSFPLSLRSGHPYCLCLSQL